MMKNRVLFCFQENKLKSWVVQSNYILMQNALTNAKNPSMKFFGGAVQFSDGRSTEYHWNGNSD